MSSSSRFLSEPSGDIDVGVAGPAGASRQTESAVAQPDYRRGRHLKIFVFTWNTESVRMGESLCREEIEHNRSGILARYRFAAEIPDFFPILIDRIVKSCADIVVIGFQEDASPGNYMHSHVLTEEMPKHGYRLLSRTKMMGVGATTVKALCSFDFKMRGLRMSIYAKSVLAEAIENEEDTLVTDIGSPHKSFICRGSALLHNKGALASYIRVPHVGTIAFINSHLPFNSDGILRTAITGDPMIRANDVLFQNICFNDIYRNLVLDLQVHPDYVIMLGDYNYRNKECPDALLVANAMESQPSRDLFEKFYLNCDELHDQMTKGNIYPLLEGPDNSGPTFLPTGKLSKHRPKDYDKVTKGKQRDDIQVFKVGVGNQRTPSWLDRILYNTLNHHRTPLRCDLYDRFDEGETMKMSDHAGVIGIYSV